MRLILLFNFLLICTFSFGQIKDSLEISTSIELETVEIIANFNKQPILGLTSSAQSISEQQIQKLQTTTLLPVLNSVPGVRMEERSPGSYRLAMRGSMIRSPFGVRNIKIYMDEFPLTDAGGNTYLNLIDPNSIQSIHVIKGPDGSLYGANSGGIIRMQPKGFNVHKNQISLSLNSGSFDLFQEQLSIQRKINDNYSFSIDQSFMQSDGYRDHSALNKKTFQTAHQWKYAANNQLRLLALYSDIHYQTPGGLTESQMNENRKMSRPATDFTPSAKEQNAGIRNQTFFGGIAHEFKINNHLTHNISIFGMYTDFENPFITNYEYRTEKNIGLRTYFSYKNNNNELWNWQMQLGLETQKGWNTIENYDNHLGIPGNAQAIDDLDNSQNSVFYRIMVNYNKHWIIEGSIGLNQAKIDYNSLYPSIENPSGAIDFGNIWMPRLATSYLFDDGFAIRASISKGYSPPTLAEVRSSDNIINSDLEPETGINYEIGARWETLNNRFIADLSLYHYKMKNGIVRQLRESGAEFYVNAGEIDQNGLELSIWANLLPFQSHNLINSLNLHSAITYNHYRFGDYEVDGNNYSNNKVTAVPDWVWTNLFSIRLLKNYGINISHIFNSSLPLNDANTVFAEKYHWVQLKGYWNVHFDRNFKIQIFVGIDNVLNEKFSLGNDINAFGNRYFNPAPERNYYAGLKFEL